MLEVITHENSPVWTNIYKRMSGSNGAVTYSKAIEKYYVPVFKEVFEETEESVCVCTVTKETGVVKLRNFDRLFVFCHQCSYRRQPSLQWAEAFAKVNKNTVFVVWDPDYANALHDKGLRAIFLPMAIDYEELEQYRVPQIHKYPKRIVWYGNIRKPKRPAFAHFLSECLRLGIQLDVISGCRLNGGRELTREEIMWELQKYQWGVGVGLCAHEMSALGLKVILYSYNFKANCAWNKEQAEFFTERNLCSDHMTSTLVKTAIEQRDLLYNFTPVDIRNNADRLRSELTKYLG